MRGTPLDKWLARFDDAIIEAVRTERPISVGTYITSDGEREVFVTVGAVEFELESEQRDQEVGG